MKKIYVFDTDYERIIKYLYENNFIDVEPDDLTDVDIAEAVEQIIDDSESE